MIRYSFVCIALSMCICGASCNGDSESRVLIAKYGKGLDSLRAANSLPALPDSFNVEAIGGDLIIFSAPHVENLNGYVSKSVFWNSLGVYVERNYFYRDAKERLQIYCFFRRVDGIDTIGTCYWYQNFVKDTTWFMQKAGADSLLRAWELD